MNEVCVPNLILEGILQEKKLKQQEIGSKQGNIHSVSNTGTLKKEDKIFVSLYY